MPLVSVIIPAYNAQATIGQAIESVLNQSYASLEIIVVDDGSTDRTADAVRSCTDPHLRCFSKVHEERSAARNFGIDHARGDYLAFLDADDWWHGNKLEKQIEILRDHRELGLVYSDVYYVDETSGRIRFRYGQQHQLHQGMVALELLFQGNFIQSPTPVVPKAVFHEVGYFDPGMPPLEDWDMWLRIAERFPVNFVPEPLAYYRYKQDSTSLARPSERLYKNHLKILQRYENQLDVEKLHHSSRLRKIKAVVHYTYGVQLMRQHRYEQAVLCFHEARRLDPAFVLIYARMIQLNLMAIFNNRDGRKT